MAGVIFVGLERETSLQCIGECWSEKSLAKDFQIWETGGGIVITGERGGIGGDDACMYVGSSCFF